MLFLKYEVLETVSDNSVHLTKKGIKQGTAAGKELKVTNHSFILKAYLVVRTSKKWIINLSG